MKMHWLIAAGLALSAGSATARDTAQDQRNVLRAEAMLCDAYESSDADVFRDNLDERYTRTDAKGVVANRDQTVASVARRDPTYVTYRNHDQTVRLYGDTAIVTGITTIQSHSGAMKFEGDFQYTDTWIHGDGRWKLAASHASLLRTR
jgi:ketosteroid isomerase-like protein